MTPRLLFRREYEAGDLARRHPPRWRNPNKQAIHHALASSLPPPAGRPTPVLVRGAERRCEVAIGPNAEEGRPDGLYGNAFARASAEAVLRATRAIDPPTTSHILAMEAPSYGMGTYELSTLRAVIETAVTGFAATRTETVEVPTIHTGYWGCGVYGGNRTLMTQLQVVAARIAGIPRVVFHAGRAPEIAREAFESLATLPAWTEDGATEEDLLLQLLEQRLEWGEGDGN